MPSIEYWRGILAKEYHEQLEKESCNRNPRSPSNLERNSRHEPLEKKKTPRFDRCVNIRFVTVRKVLPRDHRSVSEKYALDSLVSCGVLQDDSTKFISEEPKVECLCGIPEMTRIEIEEI